MRQVNSIEWNLSVMRARTIYEQLIERGIDSKRLVFKGYGNSVMLFPSLSQTQNKQQIGGLRFGF
jgi:flagellar motor protein MotB